MTSVVSGPLTLAFDTSGARGWVALGIEGRVVAEVELPAQRRQAADLVPGVQGLLHETGVGVEALRALVVGEGPGSFTGIRIAAATGRGLARALGIPLLPLSSLQGAAEPAAWPGPGPGSVGSSRLVLFDARADRLYGGAWAFPVRSGPEERTRTLLAPRSLQRAELPSLSGLLPGVALGDGAHRHQAFLESLGWEVLPEPWGLPSARGLLALETRLAREGTPLPAAGADWAPAYLRPSQPERLAGEVGGAGSA